MADWQATTAKEQLNARAHLEAGMAFASLDWSEPWMAVDLPVEVMPIHCQVGKHLLDTSDGCGCQYKCAQALILRAVVVSPEGTLKGLVQHQSLKSPHGKGISDAEGERVKRKLSKVIAQGS